MVHLFLSESTLSTTGSSVLFSPCTILPRRCPSYSWGWRWSRHWCSTFCGTSGTTSWSLTWWTHFQDCPRLRVMTDEWESRRQGVVSTPQVTTDKVTWHDSNCWHSWQSELNKPVEKHNIMWRTINIITFVTYKMCLVCLLWKYMVSSNMHISVVVPVQIRTKDENRNVACPQFRV